MTNMNRFLFISAAVLVAILAASLAARHAHAQGADRIAPYPYQALGYCQITVLSSAVALVTASCSTGSVSSGATIAEICVSTQGIRYRDDGVSPTASIGIPVPAGTCFQYSGPIGGLKMIQQASSSVLDIALYN